jgi:hypothetical protein
MTDGFLEEANRFGCDTAATTAVASPIRGEYNSAGIRKSSFHGILTH